MTIKFQYVVTDRAAFDGLERVNAILPTREKADFWAYGFVNDQRERLPDVNVYRMFRDTSVCIGTLWDPEMEA